MTMAFGEILAARGVPACVVDELVAQGWGGPPELILVDFPKGAEDAFMKFMRPIAVKAGAVPQDHEGPRPALARCVLAWRQAVAEAAATAQPDFPPLPPGPCGQADEHGSGLPMLVSSEGQKAGAGTPTPLVAGHGGAQPLSLEDICPQPDRGAAQADSAQERWEALLARWERENPCETIRPSTMPARRCVEPLLSMGARRAELLPACRFFSVEDEENRGGTRREKRVVELAKGMQLLMAEEQDDHEVEVHCLEQLRKALALRSRAYAMAGLVPLRIGHEYETAVFERLSERPQPSRAHDRGAGGIRAAARLPAPAGVACQRRFRGRRPGNRARRGCGLGRHPQHNAAAKTEGAASAAAAGAAAAPAAEIPAQKGQG